MQYTVFIKNWRPASLNQIINARHWHERNRLKTNDKSVIALHFRGVPKATGRRSVYAEINLAGKQRKIDPDNFWKSPLDALVACGMLRRDSEEFVQTLPLVQVRDASRPAGITFTLCDIDPL